MGKAPRARRQGAVRAHREVCCTVPRKFTFRITRFATQHTFATHSVQLRYGESLLKMVVLMMVTFHDDWY